MNSVRLFHGYYPRIIFQQNEGKYDQCIFLYPHNLYNEQVIEISPKRAKQGSSLNSFNFSYYYLEKYINHLNIRKSVTF